MRDYVDPAIGRIMRGGQPVGAGCLVRERLLVTCAYVVRDALGLDQAPETRPTEPVDIEFPVSPKNELKGVVGAWYPPSPELADDGLTDIALLVLVGDMDRADPCHLLRKHDNRLGTTKAYGFPREANQGVRHGEWLKAKLTICIFTCRSPAFGIGVQAKPQGSFWEVLQTFMPIASAVCR